MPLEVIRVGGCFRCTDQSGIKVGRPYESSQIEQVVSESSQCVLHVVEPEIHRAEDSDPENGNGNVSSIDLEWNSMKKVPPSLTFFLQIYNMTLIYDRIAQIFAFFRKSGSRNTMVTSDFSPEVEIWPFRACGHNYWNRSFIVELDMGQMPRSTERISSFDSFQASVVLQT